MGADGFEPIVQLPGRRTGDMKHLVHQPQDTMTIHALGIGQAPQLGIPRKENPPTAHGERKGETVRQGERRPPAPVVQRLCDSIPIQFRDTHSPFEQSLAAVALQFALVQQIRNDEFERQAKGRIQQ